MKNPYLAETIAFARVTAGTGVASNARGCVTARTGAGVYTVTLDKLADEEECIVLTEIQTAAIDDGIQVVHTSDTVKTLNSFDGGVATDCDFAVVVMAMAGGTGR